MSFDIRWDLLDTSLSNALKQRLNELLSQVEKPEFLGDDISVEELDFGAEPPSVTILDIADPWMEFYLDEDSESEELGLNLGIRDNLENTSTTSSSLSSNANTMQMLNNDLFREDVLLRRVEAKKGELDLQFTLEIRYTGNANLRAKASLRVNSPTDSFLVLPVVLTLARLHLNFKAHIAYLSQLNKLFFTIEPLDPSSNIVSDIHLQSAIGVQDKHVLRNVGNIEKFVAEQIRKGVDGFCRWPNYHVVELVGEETPNDIRGLDMLRRDSNDFSAEIGGAYSNYQVLNDQTFQPGSSANMEAYGSPRRNFSGSSMPSFTSASTIPLATNTMSRSPRRMESSAGSTIYSRQFGEDNIGSSVMSYHDKTTTNKRR